ncbi:MAG: SH3 domain-containing protein [Candidatus Omnitrophica bacterium]|nr:SH3 domain-containing protein [Candidatus Omnitrophota bacterium]
MISPGLKNTGLNAQRKFSNGIYYLFILCLLVASGCCNVRQRTNFAAPVIIPGIIRAMKTAGFWTAKIENPDKIILDAGEIQQFNLKTERELGLIVDLVKAPEVYNGKSIKNDLEKEIKSFSKGTYYTANSKPAEKGFYEMIRQNMNLSGMENQVIARYGFLSHYDNQRLLPTEMLLTKEPGDVEFDELQNSSLDLGTPLIILHETKSGSWVYTQTPSSCGWFKKEKVALCSADKFKELLSGKNFVIVTAGKADIFLDEKLTKYYDYVRMGAKFTFNETANTSVFEINIPSRDKEGKLFTQKAYVKREDANIGYLPYTQRNIIEQAFKLINSPYGWGGLNGEQDCSSYIQEVFSTVGIALPRNSAAQAKTGIPLGDFKGGSDTGEKLKIIRQQAVPGATILQMRGHIILYIGIYNNTPYVIHETHGYGEVVDSQNISWIVNRVIVSNLSLGEGSKKGSLISRIINIRLVK